MPVTNNITPELQRIKSELIKLSGMSITVGVQGDEDSELLKIARVHEYGCEIKMTDKMRRFMGAKGFFDDYKNYSPPPGKVKGVVKIPERSFIRAGFKASQDRLREIIRVAVSHVIKDKWTAQQAADSVGAQALQAVRDYFNTQLKPPKSAVTQKFSTQYQPLYDSGRLFNSITYKVESGG